MYFFLITLHILVALALILMVLLQAGKGGSLGSILGGSSSQAIFGPRGAGNFLTKLTTVAAIIFMVTSLLLTGYSNRPQTSSIMSQPKEKNHHPGKPTTTAVPSAPSKSQTPDTHKEAPGTPQTPKTPVTTPSKP